LCASSFSFLTGLSHPLNKILQPSNHHPKCIVLFYLCTLFDFPIKAHPTQLKHVSNFSYINNCLSIYLIQNNIYFMPNLKFFSKLTFSHFKQLQYSITIF
jgi:hypothetical protein